MKEDEKIEPVIGDGKALFHELLSQPILKSNKHICVAEFTE